VQQRGTKIERTFEGYCSVAIKREEKRMQKETFAEHPKLWARRPNENHGVEKEEPKLLVRRRE